MLGARAAAASASPYIMKFTGRPAICDKDCCKEPRPNCWPCSELSGPVRVPAERRPTPIPPRASKLGLPSAMSNSLGRPASKAASAEASAGHRASLQQHCSGLVWHLSRFSRYSGSGVMN